MIKRISNKERIKKYLEKALQSKSEVLICEKGLLKKESSKIELLESFVNFESEGKKYSFHLDEIKLLKKRGNKYVLFVADIKRHVEKKEKSIKKKTKKNKKEV